jgi:hypothetical protein
LKREQKITFAEMREISVRGVPNQPGSVLLVRMEYRGKNYTIVQGIGPDSWKWTDRQVRRSTVPECCEEQCGKRQRLKGRNLP